MAYNEISKNIYDCAVCHTRCDGQSKGKYVFEDDVAFAEAHENKIIALINKEGSFLAQKCLIDGYPDIEILTKNNEIYSYLEVKAQRRTFMSVENKLHNSKLLPSETVALNLSDLLRYFEIAKETNIQTSIVWVVLNRPCIVKTSEKYFHQRTTALQEIYENNKTSRKFRRKSGAGDVVNGVHKGVVINYHFSINELKEWKI